MVDHEGLLFIRSENDGRVDYFIANRGEKPLDGWIPINAEAKSVLLMDPLSGRIGTAATREGDGKTQVRLSLGPGESMIVRALAESNDPMCRRGRTGESEGEPIPLAGTWQVKFIDGGPELPKPFETDKLESWTKLGGKEAERFAGTAVYRLTFDAPMGGALQSGGTAWRVNLGRVAETARVRVNGKDYGTQILAPFAVVVDNLKPKGNVLEVEVTNLSANRIRDLDLRKVQWRYFYDINFVNINYRPFDASKWPVRDSGLLGPVTVERMKKRGSRQKAVGRSVGVENRASASPSASCLLTSAFLPLSPQ